MLQRLAGLESEYAIRFAPADGHSHPGNRAIYDAISAAIQTRVRTLPGKYRPGFPKLFLENGGSICYEFLPYSIDGGLLEAATPECSQPVDILRYQRAQEALLWSCIPDAEHRLSRLGFPGELGLLKNACDAEGHRYGPQENYEVGVGSATQILAMRVCTGMLLPVWLTVTLILWLTCIGLILFGLAAVLLLEFINLFIRTIQPSRQPFFSASRLMESDTFLRTMGLVEVGLQSGLAWPVIIPYTWMIRACVFRSSSPRSDRLSDLSTHHDWNRPFG